MILTLNNAELSDSFHPLLLFAGIGEGESLAEEIYVDVCAAEAAVSHTP